MDEWKQLTRLSKNLSLRQQSEFLIERTWEQIIDALLFQVEGHTGPAVANAWAYLRGHTHMEHLINAVSVLLKEEF